MLIEIIGLIVTFIAGGGLAVLVTLRATKKKAIADSRSVEIKNESDIISTYTSLLDKATQHYSDLLTEITKRMNESREEDRKEIESLKKEVEELHRKMNHVMEENNRLNLFVNEAFKCKHDFRDCPVIKLKQEMSKKAIEDAI